MTNLICQIPIYEPKIDENTFSIKDLNIRDLQNNYKNGCICCGNTYLPNKFSQLISSHFNTKKHKKLCLDVYTENFHNNFGNSNNFSDAFEKKCKENKELKKLNYIYKSDLDNLKKKYEILENINIEYQKRNVKNENFLETENLIEL